MDLSLRGRTNGRTSLDDFMRAMWRRFGKPGGDREGYVDHPYTLADAEATLAEVAGDKAFAREFFARYIEGHDLADYPRLLARAGLELRKRNAGAAWLGDVGIDARSGAAVVRGLVGYGWPAYQAGLEQDDEIRQLDGQPISSDADLSAVLGRHRPGDRIALTFVDRTGAAKTATVTLGEDPHVTVVPVEATGGSATPAQATFRDLWLKPRS